MKKITPILAIIILGVLFLNLESIDAAGPADSPWPQFHGNAAHTGVSQYYTSHIDGTVKWTYETGAGVESSPAIGEDGTIYIGSHDANLYAINPSGTLNWAFDTGDPLHDIYHGEMKSIMGSPAIADDGTIYINSSGQYLFAVNPNGTEKWRFYIRWGSDFWTGPTIGEDGTVYIGSARSDDDASFESGLYAINPDGTEKWHLAEKSGIPVPPTIGPDGTIYYGAGSLSGSGDVDDTGKIVAVSSEGQRLWEFATELWVEGPSAVGADGTVYTGTKEGYLYALNSDGTVKWRFLTGDGISSCPTLATDGTIYIGGWDTYLYALNSDGTEKWRVKTPDAFEGVTSSPAIAAEGTVIFGTNSGNVYAVNSDGSLKWRIQNLGSAPGSPAIASDGTVYIGTWDKKIYAISGSIGTSIAERLKGRIVLQTEENGEAWYVNPTDLKRYFLGRPMDAWNIMRSLGLGITNDNLNRIPTHNNELWAADAGIIGYVRGRILLQVELNGEAWYVSPVNERRYYMGRPADAFQLMRNLGLGITNTDLATIPVGVPSLE